MTDDLQQRVMAALDAVIHEASGQGLVKAGMVQSAQIAPDGKAVVALEVDPAEGAALEGLRQRAEAAAAAVPGVKGALCVLTAERKRPTPPPILNAGGGHGGGGRRVGPPPKLDLPGLSRIIAVASGKGGVGKSTTAVNLAFALAGLGIRVGLLDADIYGPSLPRMTGIKERPRSADGKKIIPLDRSGVKCMSIGFLTDEEEPMIWRGPMVMGAIQQMLRDVEWGPIDVMVVDMPPGTGDAQLTMAQVTNLSGAIIVSTPQDIALIDARKGLAMFEKVGVPVLGLIENMSYYCCPNCGHRADIFAHGGARREAARLGCEFLGELPLDIVLRETSDAGEPITLSKPDSPHAATYRAIAARVWDKLRAQAPARAAAT